MPTKAAVKKTLTIIGLAQAKEGHIFTYMGPQSDCKDCRLKGGCLNLNEGRKYRIVAVRETRHQCKALEGDDAVIVEVEELPVRVGIEAKKAIDGSTFEYAGIQCFRIDCKNHEICVPRNVAAKKYKIAEIIDDLDCLMGYKLKEVIIE